MTGYSEVELHTTTGRKSGSRDVAELGSINELGFRQICFAITLGKLARRRHSDPVQ
jgi:hypothetical protein